MKRVVAAGRLRNRSTQQAEQSTAPADVVAIWRPVGYQPVHRFEVRPMGLDAIAAAMVRSHAQ